MAGRAACPAVGRLLREKRDALRRGLASAEVRGFRAGPVSSGRELTRFRGLLKTSRCQSGPLLRQRKPYGNRLFIITQVHFICLV